jgi:hypothetical protein
MRTVAVKTLVIEPIWNSESVVTATPVAVLSTPAAALVTVSPARTATDTPGTSFLPASSASRCCHT